MLLDQSWIVEIVIECRLKIPGTLELMQGSGMVGDSEDHLSTADLSYLQVENGSVVTSLEHVPHVVDVIYIVF